MKRILLILAGLLAVVVAAVLIAVPNADRFRGPIQSALEKQLHRSVTLGALSLNWSPLAVKVKDLKIGDDFVSADELLVRADLLPLLRGRLEIDRILIRGARIELRRDAAGKWNYEGMGGESSGGGAGFSLRELALERFLLGVSTPARSEYGPLNMTLTSRGADAYHLDAQVDAGVMLPAPLSLAADIETPAKLVRLTNINLKLAGLALAGSASVNSGQEPSQVEASLQSPEMDLAEVLKPFKTGIKGKGRIAAQLNVKGTTSAPVINGSARLSGATIETAELTRPVEVRTAQVTFSQHNAEITNLDAGVGGSQVRGTVAVHSFDPVTLAFDLKADKLDADEMRKLVADSKTPSAPTKPSTMRGTGKLAVGTFTGNGLVLNNLEAQCRLDANQLELNPVSAGLYEGRVAGSINAPLGTSRKPVQIQLQMQKVNAASLLSSSTSIKNVLAGLLSGDSNLTIAPGADPVRGLNGTLKIDMTGGRLNGVQLMNEMAMLGKFTGFQKTADQFTTVNKLGGSLNLKDGVATTNDLALAFDGGSLTAVGSLGLADRKINLKIVTTLTGALAARYGGANAPGWMSAFLQNAKGEIVIPAVVSGSFDQPHFAPDAGRMAEMKIMPLFQGKQSPAQVVEGVKGLLDSFRKPAPKKQ